MATQVDDQLGIAEESTYGTPVTVSRFYEFVSESLALHVERIESKAIRSGKLVGRSDRWAPGRRTVDGDIEMELANKSMGLWLKHMFGGVALGAPVSGVTTQTFTPAALPTGLTIQKGVVDSGGTVRPFTYPGCKITSWELGGKVGEIGRLKVSIDGNDEATATGLATASYPANLGLLVFTQATLTVGGSAVNARECTVKGDNGLATSRHFLGSALAKQPLQADWRKYSGMIDADFDDLTAYNRFVNGTEAALVLQFDGGIAGGAVHYLLQVTCNVRFDGETPKAEVGMSQQPLPFVCLDSGAGAGAAITAIYQSTDTVS